MISPAWQRSVAGREMATRPQDPGGGEAQLTAFRDVATVRPVFQPTSQPVVVRSDEVRVSAVSVNAGRRRVVRILSTVSDSVMMVTEELQRETWPRSGSGLPLRRGDTVGVDGALSLVGEPPTVFLSDTDGCVNCAGGLPLWWRPGRSCWRGCCQSDVAGAASPADIAEVVAV